MKNLILFVLFFQIPQSISLIAGEREWSEKLFMHEVYSCAQGAIAWGWLGSNYVLAENSLQVSDPNPEVMSSANRFITKKALVKLNYNRAAFSDFQASNKWNLIVTYDLSYITTNGITPFIYSGKLTIDFSNDLNDNVYIDLDVHDIPKNTISLLLEIKEIESDNASALPPNSDINLELGIRTNTITELVGVPNNLLLANMDPDYLFTWEYLEGAEEYDLEWCYIDPYSPNYTDFIKWDDELAIRVRVSDNYFLHKFTYPEGKIYYRVRGVSRYADNSGVVQYSDWSKPESFTLSTSPDIGIKNWQFTTTYVEDGKYKKVMSYLDGSFRGRQVVTNLSSEDHIIVGDTKMDFEGRNVVSLLPVPDLLNIGQGQDKSLGYRENFNIFATSGSPTEQEKAVYDLDFTSDYVSTGLSDASGVSEYYNGDWHIKEMDDYIPKAGGYGYSQVVYMEDGTGRIKAQGGVGEIFQPGTVNNTTNDHHYETRYYYGNANQCELNSLFGSQNVGSAVHYQKDMVVDPNGVISLSYKDLSGRVIATAIQDSDLNTVLDPIIDIESTEAVTIDLITTNNGQSGNNYMDDSNNCSIVEYAYLNGAPAQTIILDYNLPDYGQISVNIPSSGGSVEINQLVPCPTCVYNLYLYVIDQNGNYMHAEDDNNTPVIPTLDANAYWAGEVSASFTAINTGPIVLGEIGTYRIIKKLCLNTDPITMLDIPLGSPAAFCGVGPASSVTEEINEILLADPNYQYPVDNDDDGVPCFNIGTQADLTSYNITEIVNAECDGLLLNILGQLNDLKILYNAMVNNPQYGNDFNQFPGYCAANGLTLVLDNPALGDLMIRLQSLPLNYGPDLTIPEETNLAIWYASVHPEFCHYLFCKGLKDLDVHKYDVDMAMSLMPGATYNVDGNNTTSEYNWDFSNPYINPGGFEQEPENPVLFTGIWPPTSVFVDPIWGKLNETQAEDLRSRLLAYSIENNSSIDIWRSAEMAAASAMSEGSDPSGTQSLAKNAYYFFVTFYLGVKKEFLRDLAESGSFCFSLPDGFVDPGSLPNAVLYLNSDENSTCSCNYITRELPDTGSEPGSEIEVAIPTNEWGLPGIVVELIPTGAIDEDNQLAANYQNSTLLCSFYAMNYGSEIMELCPFLDYDNLYSAINQACITYYSDNNSNAFVFTQAQLNTFIAGAPEPYSCVIEEEEYEALLVAMTESLYECNGPPIQTELIALVNQLGYYSENFSQTYTYNDIPGIYESMGIDHSLPVTFTLAYAYPNTTLTMEYEGISEELVFNNTNLEQDLLVSLSCTSEQYCEYDLSVGLANNQNGQNQIHFSQTNNNTGIINDCFNKIKANLLSFISVSGDADCTYYPQQSHLIDIRPYTSVKAKLNPGFYISKLRLSKADNSQSNYDNLVLNINPFTYNFGSCTGNANCNNLLNATDLVYNGNNLSTFLNSLRDQLVEAAYLTGGNWNLLNHSSFSLEVVNESGQDYLYINFYCMNVSDHCPRWIGLNIENPDNAMEYGYTNSNYIGSSNVIAPIFTFDVVRQLSTGCVLEETYSLDLSLMLSYNFSDITYNANISFPFSLPITLISPESSCAIGGMGNCAISGSIISPPSSIATNQFIQTTFSTLDSGDFFCQLCSCPTDEEEPVIAPCEAEAANIDTFVTAQNVLNEIDQDLTNLLSDYQTNCTLPVEAFKLTYKPATYHYTLYYYDQAGNLIQTVSPEGVNPVGCEADMAGHEMPVRYAFNSLNQPVSQFSPDGGRTDFYYDRMRRLRISQNAKQRILETNLDIDPDDSERFSYTKYDQLSRIVESGEYIGALATITPQNLDDPSFPLSQFGSNTTTSNHIVYDDLTGLSEEEKLNMRNRVSANVLFEWGPTVEGQSIPLPIKFHSSSYIYDVRGNVKRMKQNIFGLKEKILEYKYDLVSGKVNEVHYQPSIEGRSQEDEFIHRYVYDADNRLKLVETSRSGYLWDVDAEYFYLPHGPLSRVELGLDKVQGCDHYYNLQGWLKGVNRPDLLESMDPGLDGEYNTTNLNALFGSDEHGYHLQYYQGDYTPRINPVADSYQSYIDGMNSLYSSVDGVGYNLFNGNISSMTTNAGKDMFTTAGQSVRYYKYDLLNRIKSDKGYIIQASGDPIANGLYESEYAYDHNGNLQSLKRKDYDGLQLDDLEYTYETGSLKNRLYSVEDNNTNINDINGDIEGAATYSYDPIGNMVTDDGSGIKIAWNSQGKIREIVNNGTGGGYSSINYSYDGQGNRVSKQVRVYDSNEITWNNTYYVRDATGNIMATYDEDYEQVISSTGVVDETIIDKLTEVEFSIYGSSRIGTTNNDLISYRYKMLNGQINESSGIAIKQQYYNRMGLVRGAKQYELSNHLGNVLTTVSDKMLRLPQDPNDITIVDYKPQVITAQDYYPFGMLMPGRIYISSDQDYKYGFQGQEKDNEIKGEGNSLDFLFRAYDPRLGRFLSTDPLTQKFPALTPYQHAGNNPIAAIDLEGLEPATINPNTQTLVLVLQGFGGNPQNGKTQAQNAGGDLDIDYTGLGQIQQAASGATQIQVVTFASSTTRNTKEDVKKTIEAFKAQNAGGQVVLVGHSQGADNIVEFAKENKSININLLITLDIKDASNKGIFSVDDDNIPSNVNYAINYYQTGEFIGGEKIEIDNTKKTQGANILAPGSNHRSIDNDVVPYVIQDINNLTQGKNPVTEAKGRTLPTFVPANTNSPDITGKSKSTK